MQNPSHDELEQLFRQVILPFYQVKRDIAVPVDDSPLENDAEHSWSVGFLACAIAPLIDPKLDVGLIAQFALAHDVVEAYAGDVSNFASETEKAAKHVREAEALDKLESDFAHFPWIAETVRRYEARDSDEAKFVYAIDKYIPVMFDYIDEGKYLHKIKITRQQYVEHLQPHRQKAQAHPVVGKYYDEIRALVEANTDHFYPEAT